MNGPQHSGAAAFCGCGLSISSSANRSKRLAGALKGLLTASALFGSNSRHRESNYRPDHPHAGGENATEPRPCLKISGIASPELRNKATGDTRAFTVAVDKVAAWN